MLPQPGGVVEQGAGRGEGIMKGLKVVTSVEIG
jgi:hypothetical protein